MIYRLETRCPSHGSHGFEFFSSKSAAEKQARHYINKHHYSREPGARLYLEVVSAPTPKTKRDVIRLLRQWASHEQNG